MSTSESAAVDNLAEQYWSHHLVTNPTSAHLLGEYDAVGRFEDASRAAEDANVSALRAFVERAESIELEEVDDDRRLTAQVLAADARARADLAEARLEEVAADPIFGLQGQLEVLVPMLGLPTPEVAEAMVDKYAAIGHHFEQLAERLREGVAAGRFPAAFAVEGTIAQLDAIAATPVADDALLRVTAPAGTDVDAWQARLREVVEERVRPGMAAYRAVLADEVAAGARSDEQVGLAHLPGGEAAYAATLRYFTTTTKSAQEIHDIGLAQVAQLADEYRALGPEVVGTDDLQGIFDAMRGDPALHYSDGEQMVRDSEVAMQRAWDAMPDWFEVLPQAPCEVRATTSGAKAFYYPPAPDGSRGGTFFINTTDVASWGTFELEAMAFHEGIPGHHLQIAIASELEGLPTFRRHLRNSAYAEGWGLYTERLSDEMGLYSSAVDRLGMCSADSMRACRLVVDTGMHALGWSREQAVRYMLDNSPLTEGVVRPEIDRYAVTPGQACSYMVGRLEIQRMRREAERRQGGAFDVRAFHSAVLDSGALPLGVLDEQVRRRLP